MRKIILFTFVLLSAGCSGAGTDSVNDKTAFDITSAMAAEMYDVSTQYIYTCSQLSPYVAKIGLSEEQVYYYEMLYSGTWQEAYETREQIQSSDFQVAFDTLSNEAKAKFFTDCMGKITVALEKVDFENSSYLKRIN